MTTWARMTAVAGIAALALAACGDAPEDEADDTAGDTATAEDAAEDTGGDTGEDAVATDFKGCMVTDAGGVDDRSFNASAFAGLTQAEAELGVEPVVLESSAETDYAPNIDQLVADDCGIIVTVGFLLAGATAEAAEANPDEQFALIDSTPSDAEGNPVELDNVKPLLFNTAEAAFLAGYVAAGTTESGTVATYGGIPIPSVTVFMDGFVDGVAYFNEQNGSDVQVLGWDKEAQDGTFAGGFDDQAQGRTIAENFISQGADIILPVAGPVGLGSAAAAQDAGNVRIIGVDTDWFESTEYGSITLTSVQKNIDAAVFDVTEASVNGEFANEPYVGTLENGGVGLAPYHDFEDSVPDEVKTAVEEIQQQIIDGELTVESQNSPSVR
jgi:basic membrane protein A